MKKKNYYRVQLLDGYNKLSETLVLMAAKSNGGQLPLSIRQLKGIADSEILIYPSLNKNITPELISDNLLHIDVKDGSEYKTVCIIEQIELWETEPVMMEESEDFIL
jgi:hypothetical protein